MVGSQFWMGFQSDAGIAGDDGFVALGDLERAEVGEEVSERPARKVKVERRVVLLSFFNGLSITIGRDKTSQLWNESDLL
mgnify:CR=1 FL=1